MKDKNGWGTVSMIVLSVGLLIALLVAIYFISILYGSFEDATKNNYYKDLEYELENATQKYVINNNINIVGDTIVRLSTLKSSDLIGEFQDSDGEDCTGYVIVSLNNNNSYEYNAYISCDNYTTENYCYYLQLN